ncbi:thiamine pyrophosphate-binding protein [uncultured Bacteroides sp.]|uniref:thiamine pyrophosphate-binding protein n=1 Tax=uncultured Bacteroides sp. TaxID=162156 RepID=UPI002635FC75|nr:thiamine pyrophosphate-binding protein [uncultured Bacteroides sp.]
MEGKYYTSERSLQILISLLKQHKVKKCVLSPGATNLSLVASLQQDSWFECYSSVDERSAAYIACGMAAESGEPVMLSCTGATASRNYIPGLTEAYYRKLPILAVTSTQPINRIGHHIAQVIDRRSIQNDIALLSEHIPVTDSDDEAWSNTVKINRALLELRHRGGGPVHLNVETTYSRDYSVKELPKARMINRIIPGDIFPELPKGRIAVFIGAHRKFTEAETTVLDDFCAAHDAVVFVDHTSGYKGKYRVPILLLTLQEKDYCTLKEVDLLIHIGEVSGAYIPLRPKSVWRVNPDGELRDHYRKLSYIFEMGEQVFFEHYIGTVSAPMHSYLDTCWNKLQNTWANVPDILPFSNVWIAQQTAHRLPEDSVLFLGILNSLRTWNFFDIPESVYGYANTGGFGIDGYISSFIGASLAYPDKLYFCVAGDLAFFYDMNVIGNRHVGRNIRILLVNNGKGTEFRNYMHPGAVFGDEADKFIAAGGHYGNKSHKLVKHYAEDLGYEYLSANDKEEYIKNVERFLTPHVTDRPMLFEVFVDNNDESEAIRMILNVNQSTEGILKNVVRETFGENGIKTIKKMLGK